MTIADNYMYCFYYVFIYVFFFLWYKIVSYIQLNFMMCWLIMIYILLLINLDLDIRWYWCRVCLFGIYIRKIFADCEIFIVISL